MTKQPINSLKQPQMTSNSLKWPQAASNDLKQPQNKPQNYVWGQCWWLLSNFLVKRCDLFISWPIMASIDLNWPPKVLPQPQDFPWGGNIFQSYLSTQNLRPLSLLELLQIGFVISQICIDFANLHIIMISPQKAFLKKILWLFWVDMKVTNSKISMIPTKLSFCI